MLTMNLGVRSYKETENKLHDMLYENIHLLTFIEPPPDTFHKLFKRDMFVKNNKAAFYEIVHYLLNTLDPEMTKENLTTWPLYEISQEAKFRAELLKIINMLNTTYSYANIPHVLASHLISPGGFKIARLILKLSQLVMYEKLHKNNFKNSIRYQPKPDKNDTNCKAVIQNMRKWIQNVELEIEEMVTDFNKMYNEATYEVQELSNKQNKTCEQIIEAREDYAIVRANFDTIHPSYPSVEVLESKINNLNIDSQKVTEISNKFKEIKCLHESFLSDERILEHNSNELTIPPVVSHVVNSSTILDLQEYFHGLEILLREKSINLNIPTLSSINDLYASVVKANAFLENIHDKLEHNINKVRNVMGISNVIFNKTIQ